MSIRLYHSLIILITIVGVSACSNNNLNDTAKKKTVIHRVQAESTAEKVQEQKLYASILEQWDKDALAAKDKPVLKVRKQLHLKAVKAKPVVKYQPKSQYKTPSYKAPVNNIRYASLSGDYATNQQANSFINRMVSKHGFDRGYLNYLLSSTEATPFLKRMAYRDAFGSRKSTKKSKPRAGRWDRYRDNFLTERTISKGVQFWKNNRIALQRAEQMYGVPQEYILGIIGVETRYGGNVGKNRAIDALAAMGFSNPRRGKYFTRELEAYLLMTRKEGLDPLKPMASYAGALGLSQFMPSNIKRYAVDHDRSGSVNLWTAHDAIGSVANYFKKHGWQTGGTVAVPAVSQNSKYRTLKTGFKSSHSLTRLKSRGVSANQLGNISGKASLIKLNTYSGDELWLGGHNFYVITRYNHSSHYAMAVHQLAEAIDQRIGGRSQIRQASIDSSSRTLVSMY
ncbi:MAG: lytic murein transglycosylase B [Cocleimonas sp.]